MTTTPTRTARKFACGCVHFFEGPLGAFVDSLPCEAHDALKKVERALAREAQAKPVASFDDSLKGLLDAMRAA